MENFIRKKGLKAVLEVFGKLVRSSGERELWKSLDIVLRILGVFLIRAKLEVVEMDEEGRKEMGETLAKAGEIVFGRMGIKRK